MPNQVPVSTPDSLYRSLRAQGVALLRGHTRRELIAGASGTLLLRCASLGFGFISTVLLSRQLGASGYGVYAWALAWATALQLVTTLGFDTFILRELAAHQVTSAWSSIRGLLRVGPAVVTVSSIVLALGVALVGSATVAPEQRTTFLIALATVPVLAVSTVREGALKGLGKVMASRTAEDLIRPLGLIAFLGIGWGLLELSHTPSVAMALQALATVAAALTSWYLLRRAVPTQAKTAPTVIATRLWVRQALPLIVLRAINTLLSQIDIILVGVMRNATQVALYATATRFASFVGIAEYAVNAAFLPVASRLFARKDIERLRKGAPLVATGGVLLSIVFAAPLIIFAPQVLQLFGEGFTEGAFALRILCLSFVISAVCGQSLGLLTMTRNVKQVIIGSGTALISNVGLNVLFIPAHGANGAAVAWLLSVVIWNAVLEFQVRRNLGISATPLALFPRYLKRWSGK
jgi:O-antigen/teichoic acid export membrane protein